MTPSNDLGAQPGQLRVLHVEDNELDAELVATALRKGGFSISVTVVQTEAEFERQLRLQRPDVVIADYNLPQWKGMEALKVLRREELDIPLILVSGALGDITAVECIKQGATDYVLKDGLARLPEAVRRALQEKRLLRLRRQAEEDLARKADELARSNADLEQFAYVASHDLQEPLRMVAAYTQLLAERYRGKLDENADKFIGYASEGALRMQSLIQDLLAFSRVGRNGSGRVDCNAVIEEVLMTLGPAIQESGAVVTHAALPEVWADRSQMTQVFQNLVGNAIKFRGKEAPGISVQAEKAGQQWLFSVSDNGIGIAPQYAENIFVVFQRLHARTEYPGNGIGLAIRKKIVEHNGGKIWVEARASRGSDHGSVFKSRCPAMLRLRRNCAAMKIRTSSPFRNCERSDSRLGCPSERSSPAFFICRCARSRARGGPSVGQPGAAVPASETPFTYKSLRTSFARAPLWVRSSEKERRFVIYVDDNPKSSRLLTSVLEECGFRVITKNDPVEALALCKRTYFDLALLDYEMPLMSGSQLAREIKFLVPDVPVVLLSGRTALPATELTFVDAHFGFGTALDDLLWTMRILVRPKLAIADHHADHHQANRPYANRREMTQWADST